MYYEAVVENDETLTFVPDSHKNKKINNQAVDNYADALQFVPDCYKSQKMFNKAIDIYLSAIKFVPERFKTWEMCVKAVDDFRPISKFVPDWVVTNEIIKKLYIALFPDDYILFFEEDSGNVTFSSDETRILSVDFNINLLAWHNRLKQCKVFKNFCSMAFNRMVGLLDARRLEKLDKIIFYWWKVV